MKALEYQCPPGFLSDKRVQKYTGSPTLKVSFWLQPGACEHAEFTASKTVGGEE